jgi:hypothetical protein
VWRAHIKTVAAWVGPGATSSPAAMYTSPTNDPMSIFVGGNLKPGTYKIQNLASRAYLEIQEHSRELVCRPDAVLGPQDALVRSTY